MDNNSKQPEQSNKKKSGLRRFLSWAGISFMFLLSLALIFHGPLEEWLIQGYKPTLTASDIKKNQNSKATYDWTKVQSMDLGKVAAARASQTNLKTIGLLSVPAIDMNLSIAQGVDDYTLALSVGTMSPTQKMGEGNYALAGHHMISKDALFSPLFYKAEKGQKVYLTDLEKVYEYKIDKLEFVQATDVHVVDDVPGKKLITFVTCDATGDKRWIVQGSFVKSYDIKNAPAEAKKGFDDAANVKANY